MLQESEVRDEEWKSFLSMRGVEIPCSSCGGLGRKSYSCTSTWRKGIGGQVITGDVCDKCWGTGDANKQGANLRVISHEIDELNRRIKELESKKG